jgi:hypothetical protein
MNTDASYKSNGTGGAGAVIRDHFFREPAGDLHVIVLSSKGVGEVYKPEG